MTLLEPAATVRRAAAVATPAAEDTPHPVDVHVGQQIRIRRKQLHVSQEKLAAAIGVSFQQVQKYEWGANRVSASMLVAIAEALDCPPAALLPQTDAVLADPSQNLATRLLCAPGGLQVAELYLGLQADRRAALVNVARALCDATQAEAARQ